MAPVVRALAARPNEFRPVVCVTNQHQEMLDQVLDLFEIRPEHSLQVMTSGQTPTDVTIRVLERLPAVLASTKPAAVLVQGDTTTTFARAQSISGTVAWSVLAVRRAAASSGRAVPTMVLTPCVLPTTVGRDKASTGCAAGTGAGAGGTGMRVLGGTGIRVGGMFRSRSGIAPTPEAVAEINRVRARAGLAAVSPGSKAEFDQILRHERRIEFVGEGQYWFDLVRWGNAVNVMNDWFTATAQDIHIDEHNLVYPIPQSEIDIFPGLYQQNPGY